MNKFLTGISAAAMLIAMPALAEQVTTNDARAQAELNATQAESVPEHSVSKAEVKQGWENTKQNVKETAREAKDATKEAYEKVKAKLMDEKDSSGRYADYSVDTRMTAKGMLGKPVYNYKNEKVATVKDVILDADGKAQMIVLNDGGFFGMDGKLAAFDYALVTSRNEEGDVIMPVSEATLKKVTEFSYNAKDAKNNARVIPANGYSVSEILDADVLNARGKEVAEVENVTFLNGKASRLIVEFDGMMGMGGDQAALNFGDLKIIKESDGEVDFQMSAAQAASFESYKSASK